MPLASATRFGIPFTAVLPDMPTHPRSKEIVAWLQAHPNVQQFAVIDDDVIDDDDDCLDVLPLFQPSAAEGLIDKSAKAAAI